MGRTLSPKQINNLLDTRPTAIQGEDIHPSSYHSPGSNKVYVDKFSKTDTDAVSALVKNHQLTK
jgi:hypothetical protein